MKRCEGSEAGAQPFLVIGAMKSGTTTLSRLLEDNQQIELVSEKESSSFLDAETALTAAQAIRQSKKQAAGEVSTAYMQSPTIVSHPQIAFKSAGPELKLIAILREPHSRALSHWRHWAQLGKNPEGEMRELLPDPNLPYVQFSSYYTQLEPWIECFGAEQVLPLRLEDYSSDPDTWIKALSEFLGVDRKTFESAEIRVENTADTRVTTSGVGRRVANNSFYRSKVRPLVPQQLRQKAAIALGGKRGGYAHQSPPNETREAFYEEMQADLANLRSVWPHLHWEDFSTGA